MGRSTLMALTVLALVAGSVLAQEGHGEQDGRQKGHACPCGEGDWLRAFVVPGGVRPFGAPRARIGIYVDSWQDKEDDRRGARITGLVEGGPADEAGLEEGDVVTALNGAGLLEPLEDHWTERRLDVDRSVPVQRLLAIARELEPGEEVEVEYLREGEAASTVVVAEEADPVRVLFDGLDRMRGRVNPRDMFGPDHPWLELRGRPGEPGSFFFRREGSPRAPEVGQRRFRLDRDGGRVRILGDPTFDDHDIVGRCPHRSSGWTLMSPGCVAGLRLVPLNPRLGEYFDADRGVLVADAEEGGSLGLLAGDVILSIAGRRVDDPRDVARILGSYEEGEALELRIVRQGGERTVRGDME